MVFLGSILRFLTFSTTDSERSDNLKVERARDAMLSLLQAHLPDADVDHRLVQRIRYATNLEALWYLRQDLVAALTGLQDDAVAQRQVGKINGLFKGALPCALSPRPHHRFGS